MSNVAKLKKQAAELELKKQFDKALVVYVKLLESYDQHAAELDVALFNRVGDLMLRQGNVADAVDYYEQAVDHYAEGGFFNNAIALCNKILRHSPGRASVYYKLGKISAQKGFKNDAKQNFLEYADRMQKVGKTDEAFRALTEFADLCPDQDDIRLMLAEQLSKANRRDEALEQLQTLYARYLGEGRTAEAAAAAERMRAIDPNVQPRSGYTGSYSTHSDLIFLDLDEAPTRPAPPPIRRVSGPVVPPRVQPAPKVLPLVEMPEMEDVVVDVPAVSDLVVDGVSDKEAEQPVEPMADVERVELDEADVAAVAPLEDVERPQVDESDVETVESLSDVEREPDTSEMEIPATDLLLGLETSEAGFAVQHNTPTEALEEIESTRILPEPEQIPGAELDFVIREPDLDPSMAIEAEPEGYLGDELGARHTPVSSGRLTPKAAESALEGLPMLARPTPMGSMDAISGPLGATGADDLLASSERMADLDGSSDAMTESIDLDAGSPDDQLSAGDLDDDDLGGIDFEEDTEQADDDDDDEPIMMPTPSFARRATMVAVQSVEMLKARIEEEPENWGRHRELAEAMLEAGDRAGGLRELATAMTGAERSADLRLASALADEIARLEPEVVRHHQKRVEYAFRMNDRSRLIEAYLSLGDALLRSGQDDKARTVYQRVLDLAPDDMRARAAMDTIAVSEPTRPTPRVTRSVGGESPRRRTPLEPARRADGTRDEGLIDLGQMLRDEEAPKDLRMVVDEKEPSGDEEADFADMLRMFKQGIAENVDAEDYQSHYDLAIAYKEMGLLDEAVAEFQKALAGRSNRLPTFEALGQCFMEKGQFKMASSVLSRALGENDATEEKLIGVLYLLGRAAEVQGHAEEALGYYQRVFVVDIEFRDIAERINALERAAR